MPRTRMPRTTSFISSNNPSASLRQLTIGRDGTLYGITTYGEAGWGSVFKIDAANVMTRLHEFDDRDSPPNGNGTVAGTRALQHDLLGRNRGVGTVFKIDSAERFLVRE